MENLASLMESVKSAKEDNQKVTSGLVASAFEEQLQKIDTKYSWHSKVNNYVIYLIAMLLALLYFLSFYAYFRLEDKQSASSEKLSELHKDVFEKIDSQTKYIIQRSDDDRQHLRDAVSEIKANQKAKR